MNEAILKKIYELSIGPYHGMSMGYGYKQVGGEYTNEKAIVFNVLTKLPLSEISDEDVLPSTVEIDGVIFKTDVIEQGVINYLVCNNSVTNPCFSYGYPPNPQLTPNAQVQRPLKGGSVMATIYQGSNRQGTLGFIAKHTLSGKLVGVTNGHVISDLSVTVYSNQWYIAFNVDVIETPQLNTAYQEFNPRDNGNRINSAFGTTLYFQKVNNSFPLPNYTDGALVSLLPQDATGTPLITNESWKQIGLDIGTTAPPFATTVELNNLLNYTNLEVASTGLTTGPKQGDCGLAITQINASSYVGDYSIRFFWRDLIKFTRINPDCNYPVAAGDSGSALFAKINGVWKIIGLVFAGDGRVGYACRIDHVAQELGIEAWDGVVTSTSFIDPSSIKSIITKGPTGEDSITVGGKVYRQAVVTNHAPTP
jgi:hypothetical protein